MSVQIDRENLIAGILPRIVIEDKSTYTKSLTKKYDMVSWVITIKMIVICSVPLHTTDYLSSF